VTPGAGGGGGAPNITPNTALLDLLIQHGANVNTQVTGTRSYSMRISYNPPPNKEGTSALHGAVQAGRTDLVRYLLEKGATPELIDANGKKPIDLLDIGAARGSAGGAPGRGGAPASGAARPNTAGRGAGGRGGAGEGVDPVTAAEIRALLRDAAAKK